jgi:hypothetical protein
MHCELNLVTSGALRLYDAGYDRYGPVKMPKQEN